MLPQRRGPPRARRVLRDRGHASPSSSGCRPARPSAPSTSARPAGGSTSTTSRNQGMISHHLELVDGRVERVSMPFRYAWPAELDLMARARRDDAARALGRVEAGAVHERQPQARVGLGETGWLVDGVHLEYLTDLDLALGAVLAGVDPVDRVLNPEPTSAPDGEAACEGLGPSSVGYWHRRPPKAPGAR